MDLKYVPPGQSSIKFCVVDHFKGKKMMDNPIIDKEKVNTNIKTNLIVQVECNQIIFRHCVGFSVLPLFKTNSLQHIKDIYVAFFIQFCFVFTLV